jgi:hypothetical protein
MRLFPFALSNVHAAAGQARSTNRTMDARNIRIGDTGLDELVQRLRQLGQPQTLEALTEQYLVILKRLIGVEEGS